MNPIRAIALDLPPDVGTLPSGLGENSPGIIEILDRKQGDPNLLHRNVFDLESAVFVGRQHDLPLLLSVEAHLESRSASVERQEYVVV